MVFENHYTATRIWPPKVIKNIDGRDFEKGDKFTFKLQVINAPKDVVNADITMPGDLVIGYDSTGSGARREASFGEPV